MAKVVRKMLVNATPKRFFEIIADYEAYPQFLSSVSSVKVLERKKKTVIVEYETSALKKIHYTLKMEERSPRSLTWTLVQGDFMKKNSGSWKLKKKEKQVEATYTIDLELKGFVPAFMVKKLIEESLPATLAEFKARTELK